MFGIRFSGLLGVLGQLVGQFDGVGAFVAPVTDPESATPAASDRLDGGGYGLPRPGPSRVLSGTKKAGRWCPPAQPKPRRGGCQGRSRQTASTTAKVGLVSYWLLRH